MRVNLREIRERASNTKELGNYIQGILAKCVQDNDPPYLSDFLTMAAFNGGGVHMLQAISAKDERDKSRSMPMESRLRWRLKVNYDQWGNPPVPGEKVYRRIQEKLEHSPQKPFTSEEIEILKQTGEYEDKYQTYIPYTIDEKGCILVEFQDASSLLRKYGIHGKTKQRLCDHFHEHSGDPQLVPSDEDKKQHLHVWYYRFKEVDNEEYEALPVIEVPREPKPKRGAVANA